MSKHQVCHAHCPGGGRGGGAALVVLAVIVLALARPVVRVAEVIAEVAIIAAVSLAGIAAACAVAWAVVRRQRARTELPARQLAALPAPRRAIETARPAVPLVITDLPKREPAPRRATGGEGTAAPPGAGT